MVLLSEERSTTESWSRWLTTQSTNTSPDFPLNDNAAAMCLTTVSLMDWTTDSDPFLVVILSHKHPTCSTILTKVFMKLFKNTLVIYLIVYVFFYFPKGGKLCPHLSLDLWLREAIPRKNRFMFGFFQTAMTPPPQRILNL